MSSSGSQAGRIQGLAAGGGRNSGASAVAFARRFEELPAAQPDYRGGVRGRLVVHCGVDRDAAFRGAAGGGRAAADALHCLPSIEKDLWGSIDMGDAMDPHTLLTMGMNDGDLPVPFGGPLRLRLPRQLGYKSLKYVTHITATDDIKKFGKGLGVSRSRVWLLVVRRDLRATEENPEEFFRIVSIEALVVRYRGEAVYRLHSTMEKSDAISVVTLLG